MDLADRVVVVVGGTSGIGLGIAEAFRDEGARVALCSSHPHDDEPHGRLLPFYRFVCDVTDRAAVLETFRRIESELGAVDILVNSAGTNVTNRSMETLAPEDFDRVLSVNTTGTFNCIHAVLPGMRRKHEGLIVNIVSIAGRRVLELAGAPYCVSKFATSALGTYVGMEDAKNGIRVTNVYPGETDTPIIDKRPTPPTPERRAAMLKPQDIAACVVTVARLPQRANVPELVITPAHMLLG